MMRRGFAALLGAVLLVTTGCTLTDRAGAAVIIDGQRYTSQQLANDFRALDEALGDQQKPGTMDQVNRAIISILISKAIMEKASKETGVAINQDAIATLREQLIMQTGGEKEFAAFAATKGVPPTMIDDVLANTVFTNDLGAKLVGGTNTDAQVQAANEYFLGLAKTMNVEVAPRYGKWDPSQMLADLPVNDLSVAAAQ